MKIYIKNTTIFEIKRFTKYRPATGARDGRTDVALLDSRAGGRAAVGRGGYGRPQFILSLATAPGPLMITIIMRHEVHRVRYNFQYINQYYIDIHMNIYISRSTHNRHATE